MACGLLTSKALTNRNMVLYQMCVALVLIEHEMCCTCAKEENLEGAAQGKLLVVQDHAKINRIIQKYNY